MRLGSWHPKISRSSTETYIQIETQVCIIIYIYYMQYVYIHIHYKKLHWQKKPLHQKIIGIPILIAHKKKLDESRDQIRSAGVFHVTQVLRCRMLKVGGEAGLKVLVWRPGDILKLDIEVGFKMFQCALNYTCFIMVGWNNMQWLVGFSMFQFHISQNTCHSNTSQIHTKIVYNSTNTSSCEEWKRPWLLGEIGDYTQLCEDDNPL